MAANPFDSQLEPRIAPAAVGGDSLPVARPAGDSPHAPVYPARELPVLSLESNAPLPVLADPPKAKPAPASARRGKFWLDGNAILCACPDCRAPMTVRVWLMVADCWRCGASIELSEEQEREVERLLVERSVGSTRRVELAPRPPPPPAPVPPAARPRERVPIPPPVAARQASPVVFRREPWLVNLLNDTPAWLVSLLVHLIVFTLLALFTLQEQPAEEPFIVLSSSLARRRGEGDDAIRIPPDDRAQFDLPLPRKADLSDDRQRKALLAAAQDARELRLDGDTPNLPDLRTIKGRIGRADGYAAAVAARDPRLRVEVVTQEGGTTLTEAAVARGLRWLANHQNSDGSWSLAGFRRAGDCNCSGEGFYKDKAPGTALALLPFLGAGQTHLAGKYSGTVSRGVRWLIEHQAADGDLRAGASDKAMYAHGQATIVLCEAFAMTGDEKLRGPAQRALDFIALAQYDDGGWRYTPGPRKLQGDTSVVGWQLMALQSARAANLNVPAETWQRAGEFLDSVQHRDGALYSYQTDLGPTPAMTAEGLLCRMYLGWRKDRPGIVRGSRWLLDNHSPSAKEPNFYYWYYGTQVLHHYGGREWDEWNLHMRDVLVNSQETRGHVAGSWAPRDKYDRDGGRIYTTSLAICTLEVYYRHLPIFRRLELEDSSFPGSRLGTHYREAPASPGAPTRQSLGFVPSQAGAWDGEQRRGKNLPLLHR
jgi:hypothetical protein